METTMKSMPVEQRLELIDQKLDLLTRELEEQRRERRTRQELMDDLGVFASPDVLYNGERYPFHGQIYGITHLISSECENKDEAWKFMEWMAGEEAAEIIAVSGMIPSNLKFSSSDAYWASEPQNAARSSHDHL